MNLKKITSFVMIAMMIATCSNSQCKKIRTVNAKTIDQETINPEPTKDVVYLISQLITAENNQDWDGYSSLWCEQEAAMFNSLFNDEEYVSAREGILNVNSAKVMYCKKVTDASKVFLEDYIDYNDVEVYLVGIDYSVDHVTSTFYNGINYRYIYVGKEAGAYKILGCTEVSLNELQELCNDDTDGTIVYENKNHSDNDVEKALAIREDRIEKGYVEDGNGEIIDSIHDKVTVENINTSNKDIFVNKTAIYNTYLKGFTTTLFSTSSLVSSNNIYRSNMYAQTMGYSSGHTAKTSCNCNNRSSIKVYRTSSKKIETISMGKYLKIVLNSEMVVSATKAEALKAVMVCAHEYAYWNQVYYAKYPDAGYHVKDSAADQCYDTNKWSNTAEIYKEQVRNIYATVGDVHMHTGTHSSVFESGYVLNASYDNDSYGTLYQSGAKSKAENGKSYKEILHYYYDNTKQKDISNIGTIKFCRFKN